MADACALIAAESCIDLLHREIEMDMARDCCRETHVHLPLMVARMPACVLGDADENSSSVKEGHFGNFPKIVQPSTAAGLRPPPPPAAAGSRSSAAAAGRPPPPPPPVVRRRRRSSAGPPPPVVRRPAAAAADTGRRRSSARRRR
ncbi:hypothetical protein LINPERHAP1_LOCUS5502 [Linum perenne]